MKKILRRGYILLSTTIALFIIFCLVDIQASDLIFIDLKNKIIETDTNDDILKQDIIYLNNNKLDDNMLEKEITILNLELENIINNNFALINDVKIYDALTTEEIHNINIMIENRKNLLKNKKSLINDNNLYLYNYTTKTNLDYRLSNEEVNDNLKHTIEVINNLDINDKYLNNLSIFISPFKLKGVNGLSYNRKVKNKDGTKNYQGIIIANSYNKKNTPIKLHKDLNKKDKNYDIKVKGTVLHEIGHYIDKMNDRITKSNEYIKYSNNIKINKSMNDKWKNSYSENFAEDFRIYMSDKLNEESFEPLKKKTNYQFSDKFIKKVI